MIPGELPAGDSVAQIAAAGAQARTRIPGRLQPAADLVVALLLGRSVAAGCQRARDELIVRFQQTCAAVQAKGVEDTAAYRWTRLMSANEVGADPDHPGRGIAAFHRLARRLACEWPATMTRCRLTTLSGRKMSEPGSRCSPSRLRRGATRWRPGTAGPSA